MENERIQKIKDVETFIQAELECSDFLKRKLKGIIDSSTDSEEYVVSFVKLSNAVNKVESAYREALINIHYMYVISCPEG